MEAWQVKAGQVEAGQAPGIVRVSAVYTDITYVLEWGIILQQPPQVQPQSTPPELISIINKAKTFHFVVVR